MGDMIDANAILGKMGGGGNVQMFFTSYIYILCNLLYYRDVNIKFWEEIEKIIFSVALLLLFELAASGQEY